MRVLNHEVVGGRLSDEVVRETLGLISSQDTPSYGRHAAAFAYLYFVANAVRSKYAVITAIPSLCAAKDRPFHLVDAGAGSGASTVGTLAALREVGLRSDADIVISVIDRSDAQLRLFRLIALPWVREAFPNACVQFYQDGILPGLRRFVNDADLVVGSYILDELVSSSERAQVRQAFQSALRTPDSNYTLIYQRAQDRDTVLESKSFCAFADPGHRIQVDVSSLGETCNLSYPPKSSISIWHPIG